MIDFKTTTIALALGFAVMAAASPAMAKSAHHPGHAARAQSAAADTGDGMSSDRANALRECSARIAPLKQYTWGQYEGYQLRACMSEHGQSE